MTGGNCLRMSFLMDKFSEIELKFDADDVDLHHFLKWAILSDPSKYLHVSCPDHYYTQGLNDIDSLLLVSGWEPDLALQKDAHVFWFDDAGYSSTLSLYTVSDLIDKRSFIEIEIESTSEIDTETALLKLDQWKDSLTKEFDLEPPINESLYELYTGRKYVNAKE